MFVLSQLCAEQVRAVTNLKNWKNVLLPFLLIFLFFIMDGVFSVYYHQLLKIGDYEIILRSSLIILSLFLGKLTDTHILWLAFIFGFLHDSFYTGLYGVYFSAFPLAIYLALQVSKQVEETLMGQMLISLATLLIFEIFVYALYSFIGYANVEFLPFLRYRLFPTILFNMLVALIFYWPVDKLSSMLKDENQI